MPEKVDDVSDEELAKYVKTERSTITVKETILRNKAIIANLLCLLIIGGFLVCIFLVLGARLFSSRITSGETTDLLKTIGTIFGTSLGFVLGYLYNVKS
ncbi:MAG: hypothetical protein ACM3WV_11020 [Bacillota bacterium]